MHFGTHRYLEHMLHPIHAAEKAGNSLARGHYRSGARDEPICKVREVGSWRQGKGEALPEEGRWGKARGQQAAKERASRVRKRSVKWLFPVK